jgi:glutamine synthetase
MSTSEVNDLLDLIKQQDIRYVAFRFTDPHVKWQTTAQHVSTVDADLLNDGIMFDGSSICG